MDTPGSLPYMSRDKYKAVEPDAGDPLWDQLHGMADRMEKALSRLLAAIHAFEGCPRDAPSRSLKIDPRDGYAADEVYLVPAQYHDSAALLGVQHESRTIRFIEIFERLLPEEDAPAQWAGMVARAAAWRAAAAECRAEKG